MGHVTIMEASVVGVAEVRGGGLVDVPVFDRVFITLLDQRQALLDGGQEMVRGIDSGRYGGAKLRDEEGCCVHQHGFEWVAIGRMQLGLGFWGDNLRES